MRHCVYCGDFKISEEFPSRGLRCKTCNNERSRLHYASNKPRAKELGRLRDLQKYGLTLKGYEDLLAKQDGKCAICRSDDPGSPRKNFCVDHDHDCCPGRISCGKCVRGLLCQFCNTAIGLLGDCSAILEAARDYVGVKETCSQNS